MEERWITCPACAGNTRTKIRKDTVLFHHLIFCPRCKKEYLVNVKNFEVSIINNATIEKDARR